MVGICDGVCKVGYYGSFCERLCNIFCKGDVCDKVIGVCFSGCDLGYYGMYCN